jgi:hypothetical protein
MRRIACTALLLTSLFSAGCGGSLPTQEVTPPAPPAAKAQLMEVANSGELGSAASAIRESLEAMKTTDSANAELLLNEMTELEGLTDPNKIKAKAKAMADRL